MKSEPYRPVNSTAPKRSHLRTAGILAGGLGLAYGGIKIGQASDHIRKAALAGEAAALKTAAAAENVRVVTGAVRKTGALVTKPFRKLGRLLKLHARTTRIEFAGGVAVARYQKQLHDQDAERASGHFAKSGLAGAALGLALRKPGMARRQAAAVGAAGGLVAQGLTRTATAQTKDVFGDRSPTGKLADKVTPAALTVAALLAGHRRIRSKFGGLKQSAVSVARGIPPAIGSALRTAIGFSSKSTRAWLHGGALAGGIAAADAVTSAVFPGRGESRTEAARHGLAKGAVYGTGLALAEPALLAALRRAVSKRTRNTAMSAREVSVQFGGRQQLRDAGNRFVDPLDVASGVQRAYTTDSAGIHHPLDLPVGHAQVVRAAINKGQMLHRIGSRTGGLAKDAVGALTGREKVDSRGRPQKREWEKSWFKRAVGSAVIAGGLLGHASIMRKNPVYRAKVQHAVRSGKRSVNRIVPDFFPMSARMPLTRFDVTAPDWDVRDQRGRSARVFAPGAQPRDRREKRWHERIGNIRKAAILGALAAATGGGVLGYRLGKPRQPRAATFAPHANIIQFPKAS